MTERETNSSDHDRPSPRKDDEIIPGKHGKHGGGMESEGTPQKGTPDVSESSKSNNSAGRRDDGA